MRRMTMIATAAVLALFAVFTLNLSAQMPDTRDRTIMTFSNAVELPGLRLESGTYVFRLADTPSRNVIQVLSQDEKEMLGQWLFVPAERPDVSGDTVVTFRETSANPTPAVQFWYYPGEKIGKEFIYPKDQAMRIAARTGAAVQSDGGRVSTADVQASAQVDTAAPTSVQGTTGVVDGSGLPEAAVATEGRDQTAAASTTGTSSGNVRQEGTLAQSNTYSQSELPQTASPMALSGFLALLSLAGAAGIRRFRQ